MGHWNIWVFGLGCKFYGSGDLAHRDFELSGMAVLVQRLRILQDHGRRNKSYEGFKF